CGLRWMIATGWPSEGSAMYSAAMCSPASRASARSCRPPTSTTSVWAGSARTRLMVGHAEPAAMMTTAPGGTSRRQRRSGREYAGTVGSLVQHGEGAHPGHRRDDAVVDQHAQSRVYPLVVQVGHPGRGGVGVPEAQRLVAARVVARQAAVGEVGDQRARAVAGRVEAVLRAGSGHGEV